MRMSYKPNPRQLVLRRDTATGMTLVGWEEDLPVGRFEHLKLICEPARNILPDDNSEYYESYQSALKQAYHNNQLMLQEQIKCNKDKGWYIVPFELAKPDIAISADSVGNYSAAAMQLQYHLTQKQKQAWIKMKQDTIVHVRARQPKKELEEFVFQVWYNKQLHELSEIEGRLMEGNLIICESGLWFEPLVDQSALNQ